MRERELRQKRLCTACGERIGHAGLLSFWTARLEHHVVNLDAIKRQDGPTAAMSGHALMALIVGPNEEMTEVVATVEVVLCESCACGEVCLAALAEHTIALRSQGDNGGET